jgi:hypothetical protein
VYERTVLNVTIFCIVLILCILYMAFYCWGPHLCCCEIAFNEAPHFHKRNVNHPVSMICKFGGSILSQHYRINHFGFSIESSTSPCPHFPLFTKAQQQWFEGCAVHPFLQIVSVLSVVGMDCQKSIYLIYFILTPLSSSFSSLFPHIPCCFHQVTCRLFALCFIKGYHKEAGVWNPLLFLL